MQPLFGISDNHKGVLPSLNLKRGAPKPNLDNVETKEEKIKRMNLMYRNPTVSGDNREALSKGVLAGLNPDAKRGKHPADDEALEWMRNERKRQEERAEKRWRAKFQELVAKGNIPGAGDGSGGGRRGPRNGQGSDDDIAYFEGSPSALRKSASSGSILASGNAGDREAGEMITRLEEYCRRLRKDLASERRAREALHRQVQDTAADRDSWRLKAAQLEEQLQEVRSQKRGAGKRVAELGRLLGELGAAPAEPPTPASPASPAAAAVDRSDFTTTPLLPPATPPAVGPPPARPAAETVTEPAEEDQVYDNEDGEEGQTYEADEEAPDSPAVAASASAVSASAPASPEAAAKAKPSSASPISPAAASATCEADEDEETYEADADAAAAAGEVVAAATTTAGDGAEEPVNSSDGEAANTRPEGAGDEEMYQSNEFCSEGPGSPTSPPAAATKG